MCSRSDKEYYAIDLLSDILSQGNSSRLHNELIKEKKLFSEIHAFVMGDIDKGLFVVSGKLTKGITMQQADDAINSVLEKFKAQLVTPSELTKVKNKSEATHAFGEIDVLNKATNLAICELLGDAEIINHETQKYNAVTSQEIKQQANIIFTKQNCSTPYYKSKNNQP